MVRTFKIWHRIFLLYCDSTEIMKIWGHRLLNQVKSAAPIQTILVVNGILKRQQPAASCQMPVALKMPVGQLFPSVAPTKLLVENQKAPVGQNFQKNLH